MGRSFVLSVRRSNGMRGVLKIPNPELLRNRECKFLVFAAPGTEASTAKACGADIVGGDELVATLIEGEFAGKFNRCLATTTMLPTVMKVARFLGPQGLMPSVKNGTLMAPNSLALAIENCRRTIPFKIEKCAGLLNMAIGCVSGETPALVANIETVIAHIRSLNEKASSRYISKFYLSMPGFPGILINLQ